MNQLEMIKRVSLIILLTLILSIFGCRKEDKNGKLDEIMSISIEYSYSSPYLVGDYVNILVDGNWDTSQKDPYRIYKYEIYINDQLRYTCDEYIEEFLFQLNDAPGSYSSYVIAHYSSFYKGGGSSISNTVNFEIIASLPEINFNPDLAYGSLTDIDGNTYKTIVIGEQEWMAENLRVTHYSDGKPITLIEPDEENYPYWYWSGDFNRYIYNRFNNNYANVLGAIYHWEVAMYGADSSNTNPSGVQGVCPVGWHLPSLVEWEKLKEYLGDNAGNKIKEGGALHWPSPNSGASNESGFTALPIAQIVGYEVDPYDHYEYVFQGYPNSVTWWTSSFVVKRCYPESPDPFTTEHPFYIEVRSDNSEIIGGEIICKEYIWWENWHRAIRCVKD